MKLLKWYFDLLHRIETLEKEKARLDKTCLENSNRIFVSLPLGESQELERLRTEQKCIERAIDEKRINLLTEKR